MTVAVVDDESQLHQLTAENHGVALFDFDTDKQAFAAHLLDVGRTLGQLLNGLFEPRALPGRCFGQLFIFDNTQRRHPGHAGQRIAAESGTIRPHIERHIHKLRIRNEHGQRHQTAGKGFSQDQPVGHHVLVLEAESFPGAAQAHLDLIEQQQQIVVVGNLPQPFQKSGRRHLHTALALHGLYQDTAGILVYGGRHRFQVAEWHRYETGGQRPKAAAVLFRRGKGHHRNHAAVEVVVKDNDFLFAIRNALGFPAIKAGHLDSGLHRFDTAVLGQYLVAVRPETRSQRGYEFRHAGQKKPQGVRIDHIGNDGRIIAQQGLDQRIDDCGMMMPGIGGGIGGQAVQIALAVDIGNPAATGLANHDIQSLVMMGAVFFLERLDDIVRCVGKPEKRGHIDRGERGQHGNLLGINVAIFVATLISSLLTACQSPPMLPPPRISRDNGWIRNACKTASKIDSVTALP